MRVFRYLHDRKRPLLAHQRPALAWGLTQDNPAWFAEMRLGKSQLCLEYCQRKGLTRVLVLCPKTSFVSWKPELDREGIKTHLLITPKLKLEAVTSTEPGWYLASYQTILTYNLQMAQWDAIVVDESQNMKNPRAKLTNRLLRYYIRIPHRILLSGTPDPEGLHEVIPQLIFKDGSLFGCSSYWEFRAKFMYQNGYGWEFRPGVYERLHKRLHETAYFLSHTSAGWDTTEKRQIIHFKLNESQIRHTHNLIEHFETELNGKPLTTKWVLAKILWLQCVASGLLDNVILNKAKVQWLLTYARTKKQAVVWFRSNDEIHWAYTRLKKERFKVVALTGDNSLEERFEAQRLFQQGDIQILLMQVKIGKYSLDLSRADDAIYFSNSHSYEERVQSEKRIYHTDRKRIPSYIDLVFKDSIEELVILESIKDKDVDFKYAWRRFRESTN